MRLIHLVDSFEYVETNCFQHQLKQALGVHGCDTVALPTLSGVHSGPVVCCLKQRTLFANMAKLVHVLGGSPIVIYDQDPWESFRDGSPYKGTYERACEQLNVTGIAVTSRSWARLITSRGMPGMFVRMWMLPRYCSSSPSYVDRSVTVGFVGSLHAHRSKLFQELNGLGTNVHVIAGNSAAYKQYLASISNVRVHVRSEDSPVIVDGVEMNLRDGLWGRDIELASRGCFSIRSSGAGADDYAGGIGTIMQFDDIREVPSLIDRIESMDEQERQSLIDSAVIRIKEIDAWAATASTLVSMVR